MAGEAALIEALKSEQLYAAGLDFVEQELLPASSPLARMAYVVALPHIGSASHETCDTMAQHAIEA